jgi:hypothetical protein
MSIAHIAVSRVNTHPPSWVSVQGCKCIFSTAAPNRLNPSILIRPLTLKGEVEKRASNDPVNPNLAPLAPSKMTAPQFNIDVIKGGTKSNIVPSSCIIINRGYIKEEKYDDIKQETLAATADRLGQSSR